MDCASFQKNFRAMAKILADLRALQRHSGMILGPVPRFVGWIPAFEGMT
jgi:hypothetical protein